MEKVLGGRTDHYMNDGSELMSLASITPNIHVVSPFEDSA
jgi:hypothetical protein